MTSDFESLNQLEEIGLIADRKRELRRQQQQNGLSPKTFEGYDAEQGSPIVRSADGGQALTIRQRSLSNAAIQTGTTIASYGWDAADWKPATDIETDATLPDNTGSYEEQLQDENPDDVPEGTPGLEPVEPYCLCQTFWIRGTGEYPADDPDPTEFTCPDLGGQCAFNYELTYSGTYTERFTFPTVQTVSETTTTILGPLTPDYGEQHRRVFSASSTPSFNMLDLRGFNTGDPLIDARNEIITFEVSWSPTNPSDEDTCGDLPGCIIPVNIPQENDPATDPGDWQSVTSCSPPISFEFFESTENGTAIIVWDTATSREAPLAKFRFDTFSYSIKCAEDGPP
jgi:hypothetical protein